MSTSLRLIGAALASPLGFKLLTTFAFRRPHRHLHDIDGGLYMGRWRVVDEGTLASRILERLTGYSSIRLHRIMRADRDRDLHNHPFAYRTFVVRGWYTEQYQTFNKRRRNRIIQEGETGTGDAETFHRIDGVPPDGVWTVFCMTRNAGTWGFKVDGRFVKSTRYLLRKGYRREQVEEVQTL